MIGFAVGMLFVGLVDVIFYRQGANMAAAVFRGSAWRGIERSAEAWRPTTLAIGVALLLGGGAILVLAIVGHHS